MKTFLLIISAALLLAVCGIGIIYLVFNNASNREAFVSAFVASGKPAFIRHCIDAAHRNARNRGSEIDEKIERVCHCAADKVMASITSQQSSLSGTGAAIYRMVFDSAFQEETVMQCLQE